MASRSWIPLALGSAGPVSVWDKVNGPQILAEMFYLLTEKGEGITFENSLQEIQEPGLF